MKDVRLTHHMLEEEGDCDCVQAVREEKTNPGDGQKDCLRTWKTLAELCRYTWKGEHEKHEEFLQNRKIEERD
jgi:hypothetical protein